MAAASTTAAAAPSRSRRSDRQHGDSRWRRHLELRRTLTLTKSTVSENTAAWGAGIGNRVATLTITGSRIEGNAGGGIASGGPLSLKESTVAENSADYGAGIYNWGTLALIKSTVKKNAAAIDGGGIYNEAPGTVSLTDTKVKNNTPNDSVGF